MIDYMYGVVFIIASRKGWFVLAENRSRRLPLVIGTTENGIPVRFQLCREYCAPYTVSLRRASWRIAYPISHDLGALDAY